jgi:hypothetical protein
VFICVICGSFVFSPLSATSPPSQEKEKNENTFAVCLSSLIRCCIHRLRCTSSGTLTAHRHCRELDQPDCRIRRRRRPADRHRRRHLAISATSSKFGSAPTGFTLARGASNWTLSSTVGIQVVKANLTSTDYTLTAQLGSAPASGIAWKLNGSTLSDSAATTLTSTGTYASTGSYSWDIVVADSAAAAAIDNTIHFTAASGGTNQPR